MAEPFALTNISEVIEEISAELRQEIERIGNQVILDYTAYFEQVRQRMPALTGNAVSAVTLSVEDTKERTVLTIRQEDIGVSGDGIAGYMPEGILKVSPHTANHSELETTVAIRKVGRVVINPSAVQDPWRQAADDLGHTNFRRQGRNPTRISTTPPSLSSV